MFDRLIRPAWPPIVAMLAALAVFAGILSVTPPGFVAVVDLFGPTNRQSSLTAAYAVGAAAFFSLATLVVLAPLLAVADVLAHRLRRRREP